LVDCDAIAFYHTTAAGERIRNPLYVG